VKRSPTVNKPTAFSTLRTAARVERAIFKLQHGGLRVPPQALGEDGPKWVQSSDRLTGANLKAALGSDELVAQAARMICDQRQREFRVYRNPRYVWDA
jgi:hypothetical protein